MAEEEVKATTIGETIEQNNQEEQPVESLGERPAWLPEKFKTPEDLASSYSQLESKIGEKEEEILSKAKAEYESERLKNRPAKEGEYLLPEGIDEELAKNNDLLQWWAKESYENGYSQDQFAKGIEMYSNAISNGMTNPEEEMKNLGDNAVERVQAVELWSKKFFNESQQTEISELCATAEGVKAMETVMQALKQAPVLGEATATAQTDEGSLREMMNDPRYWNAAKRDPHFVKQVDQGFQKLYSR